MLLKRIIISLICIFLLLLTGCDCLLLNIFRGKKVEKSTHVVAQLKWIDIKRRNELAENTENKSAAKLNKLVPEMNSVELFNGYSSHIAENLRIISWNTERGRYWREYAQFIQKHPFLKNPDVVLLGEMDLGMARSRNEHTTKELADALKMNYAYAVEFLELTKGERKEREDWLGENEWGYHGNAILSKYPLKNLRMIRFPEIELWYQHYQKRLGGRMALFADVEINGKDLTLVSTHLENLGDNPGMRQRQMEMILSELKILPEDQPIIIGGDLNAIPTEPLFSKLNKFGFLIKECNQMGTPTQQVVEGEIVRLAKKQIDYIFVKNLKPMQDETSPRTVLAVTQQNENIKSLSDHAIVTVKVSLN